MDTNIKKLAALSLAAASVVSAFAVSGDSGAITGSAVIDGDLNITYRSGTIYNNSWGIKADAGDVVSAEGGHTVTINFLEPLSSVGWGIWTQNGGNVSIDGAVIINGKDYASAGLLVYDELSEISIGGGSQIYAGYNGAAVSVYGGKASIGDNSTLWGNQWGGDSATVFTRGGGTITIGSGATITQDAGDSEYKYNRYAVGASGGSSISIGSDATISTLGSVNNSAAVYAGSNSDTIASSVTMGDRTNIFTDGAGTYGLYAIVKDTIMSVGDNSVIKTEGASAAAVVSVNGAVLTLGKEAEVETIGDSAIGIYSFYSGASGANGDSLIKVSDGATISTSGTGSTGIMAQSTDTSGGAYGAKIELGADIVVKTGGDSANAVYARNGSSISLGTDAEISTMGDNSHGVLAYYTDASGANGDAYVSLADGASIITEGEGAKGVWAFSAKDSGGIVKVVLGENVAITTSGASAHAIQASNVGSKVSVEAGLHVEVTGDKAFGVAAYNGAEVELKSSTILAADYYAIYGTASDDTAISKITANGKHHIEGFVYAGANSDIKVVYEAGSYYKGATGVTESGILDFDMTRTEWYMTGASQVSDISIKDNSTIYQTISGKDSVTTLYADSFLIENSTIKVALKDYEAVFGDEFKLVDSEEMTLNGSFGLDLSEALLGEGLYWDTSTFAVDGTIRVVPEPAGFAAIFGALALAFAGCRRRR